MPPTGPTLVALALSLADAPHAMAQTDYYNTESHHPLLVEDATPLERHAFELRAAPLTLERRDDGTYIWMLTPELSYGVLPRTHVEIGAALAWRDPGAVGSSGSLAGVDIVVMHQLRLERRASPALAVALHLAAPAGGLAHDDWLASLRGMATRTLSFARVHLNGEYTAGSSRQARGIRHASRWSAGVAVDRAELLRYYRSRSDIAFSTVPKQMELMERQPYSLAFRKAYPKFNGLIRAYHWLQIGLYDALIAGRTPDERQTNVSAAVARFWQMLQAPPEHLPRLMPMGPAVAPLFAARYPEAAVIFDNLHSMHDVVSDILASPVVPRSGKREAILQAAARYRADEPFAMSMLEWREMARLMGAHNMGGPATGVTAELPTPTVPIGATHMDVMGHQHPAPSSTPRHDH